MNSYDQSMNVAGRRQLRTHLLAFAQQSYSKTATTELPALSGIPFARVGARIADLRGGIEATLKKHLTIAASYNFQWIDFDDNPQLAPTGRTFNGAAAGAKYQMSARPRSPPTTTSSWRASSTAIGSTQNRWAGGDYRLTENRTPMVRWVPRGCMRRPHSQGNVAS